MMTRLPSGVVVVVVPLGGISVRLAFAPRNMVSGAMGWRPYFRHIRPHGRCDANAWTADWAWFHVELFTGRGVAAT